MEKSCDWNQILGRIARTRSLDKMDSAIIPKKTVRASTKRTIIVIEVQDGKKTETYELVKYPAKPDYSVYLKNFRVLTSLHIGDVKDGVAMFDRAHSHLRLLELQTPIQDISF